MTILRFAAIFLLLASALAAENLSQFTIETWRKGLREIDQKLRDHKWAAAEKQSRKLADRIVDAAGLGESAAYTLAVVSAFRAIAEAGQGHEEEADWHWDMALSIFPDVAKTDLSPYGPPAAGLKERQPPLQDLHPPVSADGRPLGHLKELPKDAQPPRVIRKVKPRFPQGLGLIHATGKVVAETIIGVDGVPYRVRILTADCGPAMKYEALEALRQWRFEPAKLDGKPIKVYYVLTIAFNLKN